MGLFDEVKQNVTVRQAVELYGLKPNRSGLIRCIFHNDKSPSMKVDRRYYCFGCGCTGDAIDFTAQLFGIGLKDAAMKLADDFRILYSGKDRESLQNKRRVPIKKPKPTPEELWHTLLERDMRKEDLRLAAGMTTNMIANMSKEGKHISMDTLARICETLNCEITDVIELVSDEPASTGGKEHERIETKNNGKRN